MFKKTLKLVSVVAGIGEIALGICTAVFSIQVWPWVHGFAMVALGALTISEGRRP